VAIAGVDFNVKESRTMRTLYLLMALALAAAGCNTVRGIGQDIEKGGEAVQKAAK
jgi:predicted small secreted protein